jgi:catechol 2,3-dioxygenase-like lactoylglutathione lyase family enzyme
MTKISPAEIKVPSIHQVGIVVRNLDDTIRNYWNILGIGPWNIITLKPSSACDLTYRGKPISQVYRVATAQVGPVRLELIENMDGPTPSGDFMAEYGEGMYTLGYEVENIDRIDMHAKIMTKEGFPSLSSGRFDGNGGWDYLDTTGPLKAIWGIHKTTDDFSRPKQVYPSDPKEVSSAKIKVEAISQIGVVVNDLEEVMKNYWELLGIGPWQYCHVGPPEHHELQYHGKPVNYTARASFVTVGQVQCELLQHVSGDNIYRDFIAEHGEGIHHLQFIVEDIDKTNWIMESEGFPIIMGGRVGDGGFYYYDTVGTLKAMWESFEVPSPETWPPMNCYP